MTIQTALIVTGIALFIGFAIGYLIWGGKQATPQQQFEGQMRQAFSNVDAVFKAAKQHMKNAKNGGWASW